MASSICSRCNRPLTDAESIRLGMGPICRAKNRSNDMSNDNEFFFCDLPFDPVTMDIVCQRVLKPSPFGGEYSEIHVNVPQAVVSHSPSGFEWSYGGSGPSDFALNILEVFVPAGSDGLEPVKCYRGLCSQTAWALHQDFKWRFIAVLPKEGGLIPGQVIRDWIEANRPDCPKDDGPERLTVEENPCPF